MDRKYFIQITEGGATGDIVWKFLLCNSRATTNILKHSMTEQHKAQVKDIERRTLQHAKTTTSETSDLHKATQIEGEDSEDYETRGKPDIRFSTKEFTDQEFTSGGEILDDSQSQISITSSNSQGDECCMEDLIIDPGSNTGNMGDSSDWFSFRQKDTVQTAKTKLQKISSQGILGNPMTTVSIQGLLTQELGNPIVTNYLEYYPEDPEGENIYKLSQSQKWLYQYPRDLCAQMIRVEDKSF
ncbi:hypothetical protein BY996DRAFT_6414633 [Phakopsora pachyrhizi]|nr:hypothetical protein BY996DRAFT_6414633 [Phakopsora pachyrhizi]